MFLHQCPDKSLDHVYSLSMFQIFTPLPSPMEATLGESTVDFSGLSLQRPALCLLKCAKGVVLRNEDHILAH